MLQRPHIQVASLLSLHLSLRLSLRLSHGTNYGHVVGTPQLNFMPLSPSVSAHLCGHVRASTQK